MKLFQTLKNKQLKEKLEEEKQINVMELDLENMSINEFFNIFQPLIKQKKEREIIRYINQRPEITEFKCFYGATIMHLCAEESLSKACIAGLQANPHSATIQNIAGETFLHDAVQHNLTEVISLAKKLAPQALKIKNNFGYDISQTARICGLRTDSVM